MTGLTLGSLFDGIGVFPLAASLYNITPIWASEIERGPISITKGHFPMMTHIGDITKLEGGNIPPVDIITFGSPCQNFSNNGNREGLAGHQSSLFYHAIRIIEEMREATNGIYPAIAVWENVMGAFSSNNRMDFKAVLESFTKTDIPMPTSGEWANAGMVRGEKLTSVGECWMPSIGESPRLLKDADVSFSWQILEEIVPEVYFLKKEQCSRILHLAHLAECQPPPPIEYLLKKQGGTYPLSTPFKIDRCAVMQK